MAMPHWKYRPYATVDLPDRTWPDRVLDRAPIWCSTDLRDGNQALVNPMDAARKRRFFDLLLALGFKRDRGRLPGGLEDRLRLRPAARRGRADPGRHDDRRPHAGAAGADRADVRVDRRARARDRAPLQLDVGHAAARRLPARQATGSPTWPCGGDARCAGGSPQRARREIVFQYSPESFHHTELDYALEICEAVAEEWGPTPDEKMIVNLPTTVEQFPPNVYADRIEWFARHFSKRDAAILSVHPAQRPRHRGRDRGARPDGGRRARRGHAVRQRRAHRQRRPRHDRAQPAHAGRRPGARPLAASTRRARSSRSATSCPCTRAIRRSASSCTPRSRARTRTRSRRACTRRSGRARTCGTCRTCRSTRRTSGATTRRSSASTRSRGRAASRTSCRPSTGSTCRAGSRSTSRRRCRRSPTPAAAS